MRFDNEPARPHSRPRLRLVVDNDEQQGERQVERMNLFSYDREAFRADLIAAAWRPEGSAA